MVNSTLTSPVAEDAPVHGATVAHVVEKLREDILNLKLAPGARLVENDLTMRFAVSRGPVREALRRLAAEGLIIHVPHRGALVRSLRRRDIEELFQIRITLESLATHLASVSRDAQAREEFETTIAPIFSDAPRSPVDYMAENNVFHGAILTLAGNEQLRDLALKLQLPLIMSPVVELLTPEVLAASVREHRELALAIRGADADRAVAVARAHLKRAAEITLAAAAE